MSLIITLASLFIIALLVYTAIAIRAIWKEQNDATEAFNAEFIEALTEIRDNMKTSNDRFEAELRQWYADHGMELPDV